MAGRKLGASKKLTQSLECFDEHKKPLAPMSVGDSVQVQNQESNHPLRWDKTGQVMEKFEHGQYLIKYDGPGIVLLRARGYLKKIQPCTRGFGWRELTETFEGQDGQQQQEETPVLIPGAAGGHRVVHPWAGCEVEPQEVYLRLIFISERK